MAIFMSEIRYFLWDCKTKPCGIKNLLDFVLKDSMNNFLILSNRSFRQLEGGYIGHETRQQATPELLIFFSDINESPESQFRPKVDTI